MYVSFIVMLNLYMSIYLYFLVFDNLIVKKYYFVVPFKLNFLMLCLENVPYFAPEDKIPLLNIPPY